MKRNATLDQKVLDITQAERKPIIKPNRMRNDLGWKAVAFETGRQRIGHTAKYYHHNLNQVLRVTLPHHHLLQ